MEIVPNIRPNRGVRGKRGQNGPDPAPPEAPDPEWNTSLTSGLVRMRPPLHCNCFALLLPLLLVVVCCDENHFINLFSTGQS